MNRRMVRTFAVLLFVALALVFTAPAHAQDAASLFKTKCAACHGPDGSGATPAGKAIGRAGPALGRSPEANRRSVD